jgi:hypothetical protein
VIEWIKGASVVKARYTKVALAGIWYLWALALPGSAEYSMTDIVDAAKRGDAHAVHKLLESDPNAAAARDDNGYSALHWAAIRGHWRIFTELVEAGASMSAAGDDGSTPLHWTCHHERADMVGLLIDAGAEPNVNDRWGQTPLHVAARRGCREVAELLISRGADPNARTHEGWTPLHVASRSGHERLVRLLLAYGADPNVLDDGGRRAEDHRRPRPPEIEIPAAHLDSYVGLYDLGEGRTVKVWRNGGALGIREFAPDLLYPIGEDTFFCRQEPWRITFSRSEDGEVDGVELESLRRSVRGSRTRKPHYVGSRVCRQCHDQGPQGGAWVSWLRSGHSHTYWRLAGDWALYLARLRPHYSDLENPIEDQRCLLCHVTGLQDDDALMDASFRMEEGVSCEACHGPGSLYVEPGIMADRDRFRTNGGVLPTAATCRGCHRNSDRFDYDTWWPKIAHARPSDKDRAARDEAR